MNGQRNTFKRKIAEDYIQRVNPYKKPAPIAFDLRAYADYVETHGLSARDITPEIMDQFIIKTEKSSENTSSAS
jgi:hypothetical protein